MKRITKAKLEENKRELAQNLKSDNISVAETKIILEKAYAEGMTPNMVLWDDILKGSEQKNIAPEIWAVMSNPPKDPKLAKANKAPVYDLDDPEFYEQFLIWEDKDPETKMALLANNIKIGLAKALVRGYYIQAKKVGAEKKAGADLFLITDEELRIAEMRKGPPASVKYEVSSAISAILTEKTGGVSPNVVDDIYRYWNLNTPQPGKNIIDGDAETLAVISTNNPTLIENEPNLFAYRWCTHFSEHYPDPDVEIPSTLSVLKRMSEGDAFAAYIWGIYSNQYKGRQIFWIYGADGEEGKSYFVRTLGTALFGENAGYKAVSAKDNSKQTNFTLSNFVGARIIVYPDCNFPGFISTEFAKTISGGGRDSIVSEEKFEAAQTTTIDGRLIILSNKQPEVINANWYLSRLAYCEMQGFGEEKDPDFDVKLENELNGFLHYAKECYERLCPNHEEIRLKTKTKRTVTSLIGSDDITFSVVLHENFDLDNSACIKISELNNTLKISEEFSRREIKEFTEWLINTHGLRKIRNARAHKTTDLHGIKLKDLIVGTTGPATSTGKVPPSMEKSIPVFENTLFDEIVKEIEDGTHEQ